MAPRIGTEAERRAAEAISEFLSSTAAPLPVDFPVRSLALQSAGHWDAIGGQQQRRLHAVAELRDLGYAPPEAAS